MTSSTDSSACDTTDFDWLRREMVERQIESRRSFDARVLQAMRAVPREQFVPGHFEDRAYDDGPLPIGFGQTISQPYTVAFMCAALKLSGGEKVLEIGTGSGYAACVLSHLAARVFSIERIPDLAATARQRITQLGRNNVYVRVGDGTLGLPEEAPFDAIVVTAAAPKLPDAYAEQLAAGGRIVIPLGDRYGQQMCRFTKTADRLKVEDLGTFAFVPLIGRDGWEAD